MTNQDYITVKDDNWFVGDVQTSEYHGHPILHKHYIFCLFQEIRKILEETYDIFLEEYHCLQSSTPEINDNEIPIPSIYGSYGYVRVIYKDKNNDEKTSRWVLFKKYKTSEDCLKSLFFDCSWILFGDKDKSVQIELFGQPIEKENIEIG